MTWNESGFWLAGRVGCFTSTSGPLHCTGKVLLVQGESGLAEILFRVELFQPKLLSVSFFFASHIEQRSRWNIGIAVCRNSKALLLDLEQSKHPRKDLVLWIELYK